MHGYHICALVLGVLLAGSAGCTPTVRQVVPGEVSVTSFDAESPRDQVFDAILAVAQRQNLDVKVIEKASGSMQFEYATLGPGQLDRYCVCPMRLVRGGEVVPPTIKFADIPEYQLTGRMSISILLRESSASRTAVNIRTRCVVDFRGLHNIPLQTFVAESTHAYRDELQAELKQELE